MEARNQRNPNRNLNNLPSETLVHILTFLPIEDAVATSLISRRWLSLWSHLPHLHFPYTAIYLDDPQPHASNTRCLVDLVDRVLLLRSASLTSFRISHFIFYPYCSSHIDSWLRCVVTRLQACEIHLSLLFFHGFEDSEPAAAAAVFGIEDMYEFPFSFLRDSWVERLSLENVMIALPSKTSMGFESIKSLVFAEVAMLAEEWERMIGLCTNLEEMDLRNAGSGGKLVIRSGSIKKLRLDGTFLHDETSLEIDCPKLVLLCFNHIFLTEFRIKNVSSVVEFDFCDMNDLERGYDMWCRIAKLLPLMPELKRLSMNNWCFKVVFYGFLSVYVIFCMLKCVNY